MKDDKLDEDQLISAIDSECRTALGVESSSLSDQRAKAMEYYLGEPYGNEQDDRSHVVTREVMDTIEWIKPELMKIFSSGGDTVRFEPQGPDDVDAAEQATDYINYLLHRRNPGFRILYNWITDGLLQKDGVVKAWWDDGASQVRESYAGLTEAELTALASRDDIEILSNVSQPDPSAEEQMQAQMEQMQAQMAQLPPEQQQQAQMQLQQFAQQQVPQIHDVEVLRTGGQSGVRIECIPPEEFLCSAKATDIESSPFCAHQRLITLSELREMGYDFDDDELCSHDTDELHEEKLARHAYDNTDESLDLSQSPDPAMREVTVTEAYIRFDMDGDDVAELRKVVKVGKVILENEPVDVMPFAHWSPIIIPHKFNGLSMADIVMDLQRIQSQLFRNLLDNQYLVNNGRYEAVEGMVNLDDLLSSRPHGVVRTKMQGAVKRLDTPDLPPSAFQMLGYVDQLRERRTGVSERTQGLDQNQLNANTAATAVNQVMTAAQQRIELIARVFAETGLTDLFRLMYKLVIQNATGPEIFRLRDKYVEVDPSDWRERTDTSVVVGLGNGSREQEMLQLNMIFQNQMTLMQNPSTANLVTPINVYNTLEDQVKVFNKAASGRHFTDPRSPQAQQAAQQAQQQQQQMQQMQQMLMQAQMQAEQQRVQIEQLKVQLKDANDKAKLDIDRQQLAQDAKEHTDEMAFKETELAVEAQLEQQQSRGVSLGE